MFLPSHKQTLGYDAETKALHYLQRQGLRCLARNVRFRAGELDLIMAEGSVVVFVEVRSRSGPGFGGARESITLQKRRRTARAAQIWMSRFANHPPVCRFDAVLIEAGKLEWIRHAFTVDALL
ncbi:MAG: YraN family protein [Betaproteobacteria bacterium]|nr:YraN family protein [Betaproteobacteria bacterium]